MPRKSHVSEVAIENTRYKLSITLPTCMLHFLRVEAKRIKDKTGKSCRAPDVVRALITAYYEKRMVGLLVDPDD